VEMHFYVFYCGSYCQNMSGTILTLFTLKNQIDLGSLLLLSSLMLVQITEYYYRLVGIELQKAYKEISQLQITKNTLQSPEIQNFTFQEKMKVLKPNILRNYILEILINIIQPIPYHGSSKIGLFIIFRLYTFARVARDFSTIYIRRHYLETIIGYVICKVFNMSAMEPRKPNLMYILLSTLH